MSFLGVDALREGSRIPLSEEYSEISLSLSLSHELLKTLFNVHMFWTLLKIASKEEKSHI